MKRQTLLLILIFCLSLTGSSLSFGASGYSNRKVARVSQGQKNTRRFLGFDEGNKGATLLLGQPTGFRYQQWTTWKQSIFYDLAYDWDQIVLLGASYSFYFYNVDDLWKSQNTWNSLLFYVGAGAFGGVGIGNYDPNNKYQLGLRAYGAIEYLFNGGPWSIKAEVGPKVFLMGRTFAGLQGMVGLTYYFDQGRKKKPESRAEDDEDTAATDTRPVSKRPSQNPNKKSKDLDQSLDDELE